MARIIAGYVFRARVMGQVWSRPGVNRLTSERDDLASRTDVDQFALERMTGDHKEGVPALLERRKPQFRGDKRVAASAVAHEYKSN